MIVTGTAEPAGAISVAAGESRCNISLFILASHMLFAILKDPYKYFNFPSWPYSPTMLFLTLLLTYKI